MQKQILFKVGRRLARPVRLYALWQSEDPYLHIVAASAQAALKGAVTAEEQAWVTRIEGLRAQLVTSTEKVRRTDFGAGLQAEATSGTVSPTVSGVELDDEVGRIARISSKSSFWALFLFKLVRALRPQHCIEMGTAVGLSGAYHAAALTLNACGSLTSLEGSENLARIARRNWDTLGLRNANIVVGRFADTLMGAVTTAPSVDYVFVDGHHDEQATLEYFKQLVPHVASPACVVFDDITWSEGMRRAWRTIVRDPRAKVCVDLGPVGIVFVGALEKRRPMRAPLA